jgi:release factor glutamine methyltransferase
VRPSSPRPKWSCLLRQAAERLGDPVVARWLVEEAAGAPLGEVLGEPAPARGEAELWSMVSRRLAGEPVQYVLGHWAFRSLDLLVDRRVLIPRPETEVVVDVAIAELGRLGVLAQGTLVVDLGTGSGAIALSIAAECPGAHVWATDISLGALAVASANLAGLGTKAAGRVRLVHGDWWDALPDELAGSVSLAVANPPYVALGEAACLPEEVASWEPAEALFAGPSGLEALEALLAGAARWLASPSAFVAEIAPHQAEAAAGLARQAGLAEVTVLPDLAGRARVLVGRRA